LLIRRDAAGVKFYGSSPENDDSSPEISGGEFFMPSCDTKETPLNEYRNKWKNILL
jgi:hypothetical protein